MWLNGVRVLVLRVRERIFHQKSRPDQKTTIERSLAVDFRIRSERRENNFLALHGVHIIKSTPVRVMTRGQETCSSEKKPRLNTHLKYTRIFFSDDL